MRDALLAPSKRDEKGEQKFDNGSSSLKACCSLLLALQGAYQHLQTYQVTHSVPVPVPVPACVPACVPAPADVPGNSLRIHTARFQTKKGSVLDS